VLLQPLRALAFLAAASSSNALGGQLTVTQLVTAPMFSLKFTLSVQAPLRPAASAILLLLPASPGAQLSQLGLSATALQLLGTNQLLVGFQIQ
jgi:hypothetical protein